MKKKLAVLMCLAMLMTLLAIPAFAAEPAASVVIDGKTVTFDVAPANENGRLLVPLSAIFTQMGATVTWDGATKTATAVKGDTKVVIAIGSLEPTINGKASKLEVAAKIVDGRTLAPMRFVCEAFGGKVAWDGEKKIASVVSAAPAEKPATPAPAEKPATPAPAAAATPDSLVKASIAAFAPVTATMSFKGVTKGTPLGDLPFTADGPASIGADKKSTSTFKGDLGAAGKTNPTVAACPFSEIIAGPEADGLAVVKNAKLSEAGNNYVLDVAGAPCPASLQVILDGASKGALAELKMNVTVDYTIKIDKTSKKVVSVDVKAAGKGVSAMGSYNVSLTGSITYK